jgi:hypothetical protein
METGESELDPDAAVTIGRIALSSSGTYIHAPLELGELAGVVGGADVVFDLA